MEEFGRFLKNRRIEVGYNQTELAALIGLDSAGISKIENGKKEISPSKLESLAKVLNLDHRTMKMQYLSERFARDCVKMELNNEVFDLASAKLKSMNKNK